MVVAVFDSGEIPVGVSERERRMIHVPCTDRVFYAADRAVIAVGGCAADDARRIRVDSAPRRTHRDGIGGRPNPIHRFDVERNRALQGIEPMHARRYAIARHRIDRRERGRQYVLRAPRIGGRSFLVLQRKNGAIGDDEIGTMRAGLHECRTQRWPVGGDLPSRARCGNGFRRHDPLRACVESAET